MKRILTGAALAAALLFGAIIARASQSELIPPTSGVYTGVQFSQLLGDAHRALASCNKGSVAPANVSGVAVDGLCWIDDSVTPWLKKRYANGNWVIEGAINQTDGYWVAPMGGGLAVLASASTTDLGSVPEANVTVTGTTTINLFGSSAPTGASKVLHFDGALTLTHSASLKLPGAYPIVTAVDDTATAFHIGSGVWKITGYTRSNGAPLDVQAVGRIEFNMTGAVPANYVYGYGQSITRANYPAYVAKMTRSQNGTRTSGNATITGLTDTTGMGAGMPVEGTGFSTGCTISTLTSTTISIGGGACSVTTSGTSTVTVFFTGYGSSGYASGVNIGVPDCRGAAIAGAELPTAIGRITTAGSGINAAQLNVFGGAQTVNLERSNLKNVSISMSGTQSLGHFVSGATAKAPNTGSSFTGVRTDSPSSDGYPTGQFGAVDDHVVQFSNASFNLNGNVAQDAVNKMTPTLIASCVVRVTQ